MKIGRDQDIKLDPKIRLFNPAENLLAVIINLILNAADFFSPKVLYEG